MAFTNIIYGTIGETSGNVINSKSYTSNLSKFQVRYNGTGNWLECSESANITNKSNCSFEIKLKDGEILTDMCDMFNNCSSLTSLDLSNFDTSNVTDMDSMFYGCSSLISLDVSNFNTSNVDYMCHMFYGCSKLTSLDLSNFDTSKVNDMDWMFSKCSELISLDLSSFDISNVTDMNGMFSDCSKLTSLDLSNFDTSNVTAMNHMFQNCTSLTLLGLLYSPSSTINILAQLLDTSVARNIYYIDAKPSELIPRENISHIKYGENKVTANVTLRAIGNVEDELDCLTGDVTQRIGLALIDGTVGGGLPYGHGDPRNGTICLEFSKNSPIYMDGPLKNSSTPYISQQLPYRVGIGVDYCHIAKFSEVASSAIVRVPGNTRQEALDWLKNNLITFIYELETPIIKTVDLTTVDQDGQPTKLKTFNDITHVEIKADNIIPSVDVEVATKISETLSTLGLDHHDISETQNKLGRTIDEQTENTDATMMATTEIYEQTL